MRIAHQNPNTVRRLGQYPTQLWIAEALVERHFSYLDSTTHVIEPSCGPGAFLSALPSHVPATGVDIDAQMATAARENSGRTVIHGDFRTVPLTVTPAAIIGNPPFRLDVIDGFIDRSFSLLPAGGRIGFILPAYAFQTASRVASYAERWSLLQEMIPRNIFPGLSIPLVFAIFSKDRKRTMVGFALYHEVAEVQSLSQAYREALASETKSAWKHVVELALSRLGGESDLASIYSEIEGARPTKTAFWKEQIRRTLRRYADRFAPVSPGRYALI